MIARAQLGACDKRGIEHLQLYEDPGDAPAIAMGLPRNTRAMSLGGRESQSMAFFATPGMLLLFRSDQHQAVGTGDHVLQTRHRIGYAVCGLIITAVKRNSGSRFDAKLAAREAAARSTAELYGSRRKLPESPTSVIMRFPSWT